MSEYLKVGRYRVEVTNQDFSLFNAPSITKKDLVHYYYNIASVMLPYIKDRPLMMHRYPKGIEKNGFYQKDAPEYFPSWIKTELIAKKEDGDTNYIVAHNPATLVYLANQACITPHVWLSKIDKINYPDHMIFDLDPSGDDFSLVQKTALQLKDLLESFELLSLVKTTGSRGLHIIVPIKRIYTFDTVRQYARVIAQRLVDSNPRLCTIEVRKKFRAKKVFIDFLRNAFAQTAVAPYAVRARPKAPIATPIDWQEVADKALRSDRYTIKTVLRRLEKYGDPFNGLFTKQQTLKHVMQEFNIKID